MVGVLLLLLLGITGSLGQVCDCELCKYVPDGQYKGLWDKPVQGSPLCPDLSKDPVTFGCLYTKYNTTETACFCDPGDTAYDVCIDDTVKPGPGGSGYAIERSCCSGFECCCTACIFDKCIGEHCSIDCCPPLIEATDVATPPGEGFKCGTAAQEGGHKVEISCGLTATINITSAFWGIEGVCHSATALVIAQGRCQGDHSCTLPATDAIWGNPCPTKWKFLQVCWACVE